MSKNKLRVEVLQPLYDRLKKAKEGEFKRCLVYGLSPDESGTPGTAIAVTLVHYKNQESLKLATLTLPHGFSIVGLVEFEGDEDQELYAAVDNVEDPVLFKVVENKVTASTGLDFLTPVHMDITNPNTFWGKTTCTFHIHGEFLLSTILETPDIKDCFVSSKKRILNQAAYTLGKDKGVVILPRTGFILDKSKGPTTDQTIKVNDLLSTLGNTQPDPICYFKPGIGLIQGKMLFDQTKSNAVKKSTILISDRTPWCKMFEHYVDIDIMVVAARNLPANQLLNLFNSAAIAQLEYGFQANIELQLLNSISADKPEPFHFWLPFAEHFATVLYPVNTAEEKLTEIRHELHELFSIKELRPYFRRSGALFQPCTSLISPHYTLKPKYTEKSLVVGNYEYKHYMQDEFNDNGWGCAYRSLQTIVSWFRLQGFTSIAIPTHKEIQECLVSLGDKPPSFVGSKNWIGSTEVGFVLEALLGVSSRILSMSSGAEIGSSETIGALHQHFKTHGTPVMIGGGVYAHTIIGISHNPLDESEVEFLVLDPHYTGGDELSTIKDKGWVGWKEKKFWNPKDFYNICMPLVPSTI